jgi:hypothetical protein
VERQVCRHTAIVALPPCGFRLLINLSETCNIRSIEESSIRFKNCIVPGRKIRSWSYANLVPYNAVLDHAVAISMTGNSNEIHVFVGAEAFNADASNTERLTVDA